MEYLLHSNTTIKQSITTFYSYHCPTASAKQCLDLLEAASNSYVDNRNWLSHFNRDIDEEAFARALRVLTMRAWYLDLPYRYGICRDTELLKRVQRNHSTAPWKVHSTYQPPQQVPAGMAMLTVPTEQVPFLKQQLEVMALLEQ
jgi:hypothetical protein